MADQGTQGLLSPFLRRQRFRAARPFLKGSVLDFGCGSGALAEFVPFRGYLGYDVDQSSLSLARRSHPQHRFTDELPRDERFDTVVALAVIEHVKDPAAFLTTLAACLRPAGSIVCTTPHPLGKHVHKVGAGLGIFSRDASEEHEDLLGRASLAKAAALSGLSLATYSRFLVGLNQLAVFVRAGGTSLA